MNRDELLVALREAMSIVEEADAPEDLRPTALECVWTALVHGESGPQLRGHADAVSAAVSAPEVGLPQAEFARRLGLDPDDVADAFRVSEDGRFEVDIPSTRLPTQRTSATIDIALLVCAGRQFSFEEATSGADIRPVLDDFGRLDGANFAGTMSTRTDLWSISGGGPGRPATYRLRRPAWREAGDVVRRLLGR